MASQQQFFADCARLNIAVQSRGFGVVEGQAQGSYLECRRGGKTVAVALAGMMVHPGIPVVSSASEVDALLRRAR